MEIGTNTGYIKISDVKLLTLKSLKKKKKEEEEEALNLSDTGSLQEALCWPLPHRIHSRM